MKKLKRHRVLFIIFITLSIISILDIVTRSFGAQVYDLAGTGIITYYLGIGFIFILGSTLGGAVMAALDLILSFTIIWVGIAIYEYTQMEKQKKSIQKSGSLDEPMK